MTHPLSMTSEIREAFLSLSHDRNPLHLDETYSKRTPFGQPVVYGMAGVLAALGKWANGKRFCLRSIQAEFRKPLFWNDTVTLETQSEENRIKLRIVSGVTLHTLISATVSEWNGEAHPQTTDFVPIPHAQHAVGNPKLPDLEDAAPHYRLGKVTQSQLSALGLSQGQIPVSQLTALAWASYFVGMISPGQQALFSDFNFEFDPKSAHEPFQLRSLQSQFDHRFGRFSFSGGGVNPSSFKMTAFRRPEPVNYSISEIEKVIGRSTHFRDKTVFITGSSRGFGAVLAKAFVLQGACVVVNYRSSAGVQAMLDEAKTVGGQMTAVQGDVTLPSDCERMAADVQKSHGGVDLLIHNAFPAITAKTFLNQSEFSGYVADALNTAQNVYRTFLPRMRPHGLAIQISSIYVDEPKENFAHYIAAKSAVDDFVRTLVPTFKNLRYLIFKAPRMLTDQTNVGFDLDRPVSAIHAAQRLLDQALIESEKVR